ncbi:M24 family metallopeptidase [Sinorhizobium meliloti]|uniref:M24 family metallopeptidase n=1 Tax=Rhizobium meliloti TaxID=382 RepID=UPI003D65696A
MGYPFGETIKGSDAGIPKNELDRHVRAAQKAIQEKGLDLLLLTGPENIYYLSAQQTPGYYMFQCLCVPAEGEPFLFVRGLEAANARANTFVEEILFYEDGVNGAARLADELVKRGYKNKRVGIDRRSWFLTIEQYETFVGAFGTLHDASGLLEPLRAVKSGYELEQIEKAAVCVELGMVAALKAIREGATENDVAAAMINAAYLQGSEYVGMEPFVCSGPRSGLRHATWRRRVLKSGDLVTLENAACVNRYHSALFRTACVGPNVDEKAKAMREACVEGLDIALAELKPGNSCADVHNAVQKVIDKHGFTEHFRKRAGYSVGIAFAPDWGEGNVLSLNHDVDTELQPGMVFHMPISLCVHGVYTVCASETAIVTKSGSKALSSLDRRQF